MNIKQLLFITAFVAGLLSLPGVRAALCHIPLSQFAGGFAIGIKSVFSLILFAECIEPGSDPGMAAILGWITARVLSVYLTSYATLMTLVYGLVWAGKK